MFPPTEPWKPDIDWNCTAGIVLKKFLDALPADSAFEVTVFGSAPLQLGLDSSFLSGDVDIFKREEFVDVVKRAGLEKGSAPIYVELTQATVFVASPLWPSRAYRLKVGAHNLVFPHPIDILVSKIKRLAPKDMKAFQLVREKTGHPTDDEMIRALQDVVDIYRPAFDEEAEAGDPMANTICLFDELYSRKIDVRAEIIVPALQRRREAYGLNAPDYKSGLRDAAEGK
jgi:hypothetical protein